MLLDPRRMLFLGIPPGTASVHTSTFFDEFNVNDFLLVAWNAETFVADTERKTGQPFESYHHPFVYNQFKEMYEMKVIEIIQWIKNGHVLVVFPYLFNIEMKTGWLNKTLEVNISRFPPFNLVDLTHSSGNSLQVAEGFHAQFSKFLYMFKYNMAMSGDNMIPLFTYQDCEGNSIIASAIFLIGKGAVVFSPQLKSWSDPNLVEYLKALGELPNMLNWPVDASDRRAGGVEWPAFRFTAFPAVIIAIIAFSPFWAPQVGRLLPWGKPLATGQDYAAPLTEMEKRRISSSFDVDAIKSTEHALEHHVNQLKAEISRLRKLPTATSPKVQADPTAPFASAGPTAKQSADFMLPAAGPHLSAREITELLARGDEFVDRRDITSARLFYERAANAGDGQAALRLGATFDPAYLGRATLGGVVSDNAQARLWYQRARALGEAEAERRLKRFETK